LPFEPALRIAGTRLTVGVAPMCYADPRVWPKPDAKLYEHHISSLGSIAARASKAGHDVVMFGTDRPDRAPVAESHERAIAEGDPARIRVVTPASTPELMGLLASVDVVVAARFHGVLLAHVAGKPVLAVSHERKVATLMSELGHDKYCLPIDRVDPAAAYASVEKLLGDRESIGAHIAKVAGGYRRRVEEQYDTVFGSARPAGKP
jgi:polysaccharide pyruvyl transferase WcaK-like protein